MHWQRRAIFRAMGAFIVTSIVLSLLVNFWSLAAGTAASGSVIATTATTTATCTTTQIVTTTAPTTQTTTATTTVPTTQTTTATTTVPTTQTTTETTTSTVTLETTTTRTLTNIFQPTTSTITTTLTTLPKASLDDAACEPVTPAPSYQVSVSTAGAGTVSPGSGTYSGTADFTATPQGNALFLGWTVDGTFVGFGNPLALPVTKNRTVLATFAPPPTFCDVNANTPGVTAITQLAARGIILGSDNPSGSGKCFRPDDPLFRAHVAGMIARAYGWDGEDHGNNFTDKGTIDNDLWRNVGTLAYYNVALGYRDGSYDPTGPVLKAQAISFTSRAMIRKDYWELQEDNATYYTAVPMSSGHRQDAVTYHFYAGNILGTNAPTDPWGGANGYTAISTRGYFAQVLWQAYSSYFSTNHIP